MFWRVKPVVDLWPSSKAVFGVTTKSCIFLATAAQGMRLGGAPNAAHTARGFGHVCVAKHPYFSLQSVLIAFTEPSGAIEVDCGALL